MISQCKIVNDFELNSIQQNECRSFITFMGLALVYANSKFVTFEKCKSVY